MQKDISLNEAFNWYRELNPWINTFDGNGTIWNPIGYYGSAGTSNALLRQIRTAQYNRMQRWFSTYIYYTNGYAQSAISNTVNLVLGNGFEYVAETKTVQKQIDEWIEINDWNERQKLAFEKFLVQGECFIDARYDELRFIDPDLIYSGDNSLGVIRDNDDYEKVIGYNIKDQEVSAEYIQHRKHGWPEDPRGTSYIFPVIRNLIDAVQTLNDLNKILSTQAKFAVIRKWNSPKEAVQALRSEIRVKQTPANNCSNENIERYEAGDIHDAPMDGDIEIPSTGVNSEQYLSLLRGHLRAIAGRMCIPENTLSQDQSEMGAYSASLVAESPMVKGLEKHQKRIGRQDLKLMQMCGIDTSKVNIIYPEVSMHDKQEEVAVCNFGLLNGLISRQTAAKYFEWQYEDEQKIIKQEQRENQINPPEDPNNKNEDNKINSA